uniref:G-type lectin S-receptor-like serine/threonine-protein kinase n=1 Tax=Populus alba TaxID=43335 RepID=A0A4U5R313_POPAL|nr:G-type lectin S-receptor-like serine/threonine-protein kinase [Populus alba]
MGLEQESNPEVVAWKGSKKQYRSGPWNGVGFSGSTEFMPNPVFDFTFVSNNVEVYYTFNLKRDREAKAKMKIAAIATAAFVFILGILTISYHILKEKAKFAGKVSQTDHLH